MATTRTYFQQMWDRVLVIGRAMDVDLSQAPKETRVAIKAVLVMIAVVLRALFAKGVLADADLLAVLDAARDDAYDREPDEPPEVTGGGTG